MEKSEIKGFIAKRVAQELKDGDVVNLGITPRKAQRADGIRYADLLPRAENEPVFQRAADADQRQHRNRRLCGRRRQPDHHQRTIRTTLTPKHTNMYRNRTR